MMIISQWIQWVPFDRLLFIKEQFICAVFCPPLKFQWLEKLFNLFTCGENLYLCVYGTHQMKIISWILCWKVLLSRVWCIFFSVICFCKIEWFELDNYFNFLHFNCIVEVILLRVFLSFHWRRAKKSWEQESCLVSLVMYIFNFFSIRFSKPRHWEQYWQGYEVTSVASKIYYY